jgi:NADH-quinone oxidoreductase subunit L
MHTETYPQLIPLVILIPALGAFINIFWGSKLTERVSGLIGITAAVLTFIISVLIFSHLNGHHGTGSVINPVIFQTWLRIDSIGLDIPWQFRVDPLTAVMLLVVTGVGSLIHIYSMGYMHGDKKFSRFFAYLNLFMMFMLLLVTSNNFLMLFVGWEGVGVMSYLLIGFNWDKGGALGWKNANAARKAMIVNRVGDFGVLMAIFMIFWTFGTLTFYQPGETANVCYAREVNNLGACAEESHSEGEAAAAEGETAAAEGDHSEGETVAEAEGDHSEGEAAAAEGETVAEAEGDHSEGETAEGEGDHSEGETAAAEGDHSEGETAEGEGGHGGEPVVLADVDNSKFASYTDLGVFGQTAHYMSLEEGSPERLVQFGTLALDFKTVLFIIVLFLLLGVAGKSAQIPLFVWLPDAMAGPTPVSALMHAATMVTAGVFLLIRSNVFLDYVPEARLVIAIIGSVTALMAGFIALGQWDIKRVLAFSTVSQLGFMVAAVGLGAYVAALFHLATHAVFKALLFLGSGSVIHGVEHGHHHVHAHGNGPGHGHGNGPDDHHDAHDEHVDEAFDPQDMRNMGGLASRMPITYWTYLFGTFALAGLPFFAGFWSKDEILADAFHEALEGHLLLDNLAGYIVLGLLLVAAGFTAFYMWRQVQMVFHGDPRTEAAASAPESSAWMTIPLLVLAFFSFTVGFVNVPKYTPIFSGFMGIQDYEFKHFLESAIPSVTLKESLAFNTPLALLAVVIAFSAIALSHSIYGGNKAVQGRRDPLHVNRSTRQMWSLANARLYWDEIYFRLIENPYNRLSKFLYEVVDWRFLHDYFHDSVLKAGYDSMGKLLAKPFDLGIIDGTVNGVGALVRLLSGRVRVVQTGYVRVYAVILLLGVVAVLLIMLLPLLQVQAGS